MKLRQLEVFIAVAESGSFSRAAETVLLTQSTVSQHIASLEGELGVQLFDRTGRGAELTEGGRLFEQRARKVLGECLELRQAMARFRGMEEPRLSVGGSNIPANYLLPELLPLLAARYPGIVLSVVAGDSREVVDWVLSGEVALAVVGDRYEDDDLCFTPLLSDQLLLVVGAGHPWRERPTVELEELATTPLVVREAGSGSGRAVDQALRQAGFEPGRLRVMAHLGSNEAVKQAVIGGRGAAFLSSLSIRRELLHGDLQVVPLTGVTVVRRFWLATRRARTLSPAAQAFAGLLLEIYGDRVTAGDAPPDVPTPDRCTSPPGR